MASLTRVLNAASPASRLCDRRLALLAAIHLAAVGMMFWYEAEPAAQLAFILCWGLLNFFWLLLLRRPLTSAAISLALILALTALSQFKHSVLLMTATFVDLMLIDFASISFLLAIFPGLAWKVGIATGVVAIALVMLWRIEPFHVRRSMAALGCGLFFLALTALAFAVPMDREDEFLGRQYVSKFARSAAVAAVDLGTRGLFEADAVAGTSLPVAAECDGSRRGPHIVMVFDESSFDATMLPNVNVLPNYRDHFRSVDGKLRSLIVEGAGGPSWFTEYNVLTGLSVHSYGRFAESVTRLAAGRVKRGLPQALRNCGYKTYSLYSWFGAFAGARRFHTTTGIEHFLDARQLRSGSADTDSFYYDHALNIIEHERGSHPVFLLVYLAVNHFPWNYRYRPDLLPEWVNPGNPSEIDEYLRRQEMSARDYARFRERLAHMFPDESFLIIRFGDHQPRFAKHFLDLQLSEAEVGRRILARDLRYFTTYYAVDAVNFRPVDLSSALDPLDAPYLPLVVLDAAGLPTDASFAEQRRILRRCKGLFYLCSGGGEVRRFNRLLLNAGLIEGL